MCPGPAEARGAAVRLHRHLGAGEAERVEAGLQRVEIALHDRLHVGVEHGRVGALVLAPLAGDFVGGGDAHARQALAQVGLARGLVRGRGVGVEELDGDGLHSLGPAHLDHRVQVFEMQRRADPPPGVDALAHLEPEPARHEGDLLAVAQIVEIGAVAACDLEHVAEALGGDQRGLRAGPLGDRVDHRGSAMDEVVHLLSVEARLLDGVEHTAREIARRAERLGDAERAGFLIEMDEVGEGPADIGRKSAHRMLLPAESAPIIHRRRRGSNRAPPATVEPPTNRLGPRIYYAADAIGVRALLGNTIPTGAILVVLIAIFGSIPGAHFNPAVTLCFLIRREIGLGMARLYLIAQVAGAICGAMLAHGMFEEPIVAASMKARTGFSQWLGEFTATLGW